MRIGVTANASAGKCPMENDMEEDLANIKIIWKINCVFKRVNYYWNSTNIPCQASKQCLVIESPGTEYTNMKCAHSF
jgi:hypothetical protein